MISTKNTKRRSLRLRHRRGQSTVEYSIITHALLFGTGLAATAPVIPGSDRNGMVSLVGFLLESMQKYYDNIYQMLSTGAI
jgi:hypothetical protein